ncbi:MAG: GntR family transcriptional regulator [Nannocystaceae bacterium]
MPRWPLQLLPARTEGVPVFAAIARAIAHEVQRGRLRAGDRLPSTRELAAQLELHRNTVVAAYRELLAEGWVTAGVGRGTFVAERLAQAPRASTAARARDRSRRLRVATVTAAAGATGLARTGARPPRHRPAHRPARPGVVSSRGRRARVPSRAA